MKDGTTLPADLIVLATGYKPQEHLVRKLFGEEVVGRIGPIWGYGDGQELRNMYTAHRPAWLVVHRRQPGAMPDQFEYLALQIKAIEAGLLPRETAFSNETAADSREENAKGSR